jgi:hypothetical protein
MPEVGEIYRVRGRNFSVAVWNGWGWIGIREKFGYRYLDTETATVRGDAGEKLGDVPAGVLVQEQLAAVDRRSGWPVRWDEARREWVLVRRDGGKHVNMYTGKEIVDEEEDGWKESIDPLLVPNDFLFNVLDEYNDTVYDAYDDDE